MKTILKIINLDITIIAYLAITHVIGFISSVGRFVIQVIAGIKNKLLLPLYNVIKEIICSILYDREGYISRKLIASWILTSLITVLALSHIIAYHLLGIEVPQLVESKDFVTFLEILWASYFSSNVIKGISISRNRAQEINRNVVTETNGDSEIPG